MPDTTNTIAILVPDTFGADLRARALAHYQARWPSAALMVAGWHEQLPGSVTRFVVADLTVLAETAELATPPQRDT